MAVAGIISQKTERPVKVLFGGLDAYWSDSESGMGGAVPIIPKASTTPAIQKPSTPATPSAPVTPPASEPAKPKRKSAGC